MMNVTDDDDDDDDGGGDDDDDVDDDADDDDDNADDNDDDNDNDDDDTTINLRQIFRASRTQSTVRLSFSKRRQRTNPKEVRLFERSKSLFSSFSGIGETSQRSP
ncbi:hypothetical protein WUBG_04943 [Wuchereria bancrofti]|uniref:Uncharacterized protein n=1 Tax=Wuchereria bancrofti TaxID=6293 RepID=J9F3V5_WUCBA|nr:hypothetical protein WUBG_04943 [Wuchereria bancrofti]